jgi:hypothetical protein
VVVPSYFLAQASVPGSSVCRNTPIYFLRKPGTHRLSTESTELHGRASDWKVDGWKEVVSDSRASTVALQSGIQAGENQTSASSGGSSSRKTANGQSFLPVLERIFTESQQQQQQQQQY